MEPLQENLLEIESQSKNNKNHKKFFFIFLILLFTIILCSLAFILTLLKHHVDSQSLSTNPIEAIRSVCRVTPDYFSCFGSISSLQYYQRNQSRTNIINPSDIVRLSIQAAFEKFSTVRSLPDELPLKFKNPKIGPAFTNCKNTFADSFTQLNESLIKTSSDDFIIRRNYEKILADDQVMMLIKSLKDSMIRAIDDVGRCLEGLEDWTTGTDDDWDFVKNVVKMRVRIAKVYISNGLAMLENLDSICEMFHPTVLSILGSFMLGREYYVLTIGMFSLQYLVLLLLFCSLLRVFEARSRK